MEFGCDCSTAGGDLRWLEFDGRRTEGCVLHGAVRVAAHARREIEGWGSSARCATGSVGWNDALSYPRAHQWTAFGAGFRKLYLTTISSPGRRHRANLQRLQGPRGISDDLCARGAPNGRVADAVEPERER